MVKKILEAAGFVEGKTYKAVRFLKPPAGPYCIYLDSYERRGGDGSNLITDHSYMIELYAPKPADGSEEQIEKAFDAYGIAFDKQTRTWLQDEQLYQTIYEFDYAEKES